MIPTTSPHRRGLFATGAILCSVVLGCALLAPWIAPDSPATLGEPVRERFASPSHEHWFGTDILGRDLYARVVHGSRTSIEIALFSVSIALVLGLAVGLASAWFGGWSDQLLMRLTDLFLAFPRIFLVLLLIAYVRPGSSWIILVLGTTGWMGIARIVRAQVLQLRETEYVVAAQAMGAHPIEIVRRHVLPALALPCLTLSALGVGQALLAESFLSFVGLGIQDPDVSWGMLIRGGRDMLLGAWWLALFPGMAIALSVVGFHLLGDGLGAAIDPLLRSPKAKFSVERSRARP